MPDYAPPPAGVDPDTFADAVERVARNIWAHEEVRDQSAWDETWNAHGRRDYRAKAAPYVHLVSDLLATGKEAEARARVAELEGDLAAANNGRRFDVETLTAQRDDAIDERERALNALCLIRNSRVTWQTVAAELLAERDQARAALARVRALAEQEIAATRPYVVTPALYAEAVLAALDGTAEEADRG